MSVGVLTLVVVLVAGVLVATTAWWLRRRARWMADAEPIRRADDGRSARRTGPTPGEPRRSHGMRGGGGGS